MKKIMFNDKYGLTEAVLGGRKTQTRRIVPRSFFTCTHDILDNNTLVFEDMYGDWHDIRKSAYALKVGEVIAVAQSYKDIYKKFVTTQDYKYIIPVKNACDKAGWTNKMFVRANLMPHHIRIINVRVERLQDISDEDCIKEGVQEVCVNNNWGNSASHWEFQVPYEDKLDRTKLLRGATPQETFAALIDKISGYGTWETNPYVFAYEFELVD